MQRKIHHKNNHNDNNEQTCLCHAHKNYDFQQYQQNIKALSQELQEYKVKNGENLKLVGILTEERNFYQEQLKRSEYQKNLLDEVMGKYRIEMQTKNILIKELKKASKQLEEEAYNAKEELEEIRFMFEAQEQQVNRVMKEKQLIEAEWGKVIKEMNFKMKDFHKKHQQQEKQNQQFFSNLPLQQKVQKALKKLDREINQSANFTNIQSKKGSTFYETDDISI